MKRIAVISPLEFEQALTINLKLELLMQNNFIRDKKMSRARTMYLAPLDAIWPPLALIMMAAIIGLISAAFGIKSLVILAIAGIAILIGDCFGRSKDYLNARSKFVEARDRDEKIEVIRRFRRAWCARVACSAAWRREYAGLEMSEDYVDDAYFKMGYRWWHYFPDGTFTKNSPFLKLAFWIHLFTGKMKRDHVEQHKPGIEPAE
jgi:hypothetical protein